MKRYATIVILIALCAWLAFHAEQQRERAAIAEREIKQRDAKEEKRLSALRKATEEGRARMERRKRAKKWMDDAISGDAA